MLHRLTLPQRLGLILGMVAIATGITVFFAWKRPGEEQARIEPVPDGLTMVEILAADSTNMEAESTLESIENLPSFNDVIVAECNSTPSGTMMVHGTYWHTSTVIPKLCRVRKILQEGRSARNLVVPKLKEVLVRSLKDLDKAYKQHREEWGRKGYKTSLDRYEQATTCGPAAVYLLEELDAFDALPLLCDVYYTEERIPVHRLFLVYAMHLLATRHPREGLSREARVALDDYLKAAKDLPSPHAVDVPAWNAILTETDLRAVILGQEMRLCRQPQIRLYLYPHVLHAHEDWRGTIQVSLDPLVEEMTRFIDLAYPPRKD